MISVPNHPRPSNGNKCWILALLIAGSASLFPGCALFQPANSTERTQEREDLGEITGGQNRSDGQNPVVPPSSGELETFEWQEVSEREVPPIESDGRPVDVPGIGSITGDNDSGRNPMDNNLSYGNTYRIAYLLPFLENRFNYESGKIENSAANWSMQFYLGSRLALDDLRRNGHRLKVHVFDTKGEPKEVESMLNSDQNIKGADLIIGPYRRENIQLVAEYGKNNRTVVVSPYSAAPGLTQNNPYFIQVNPAITTHCQALVRHATAQVRPEEVVLVYRNNSLERYCAKEIQKAYQTQMGSSQVSPLRELQLPNDFEDYQNMDLRNFVQEEENIAFIVPSWQDEKFIITFLRVLDNTRHNDQEISVYGMPGWMNYEYMDYSYYEKLNVHVSSNYYIDEDYEEVAMLKQRFYDTYRTLPIEAAYIGYDMTHYFATMLENYGQEFPQNLERATEDYLHSRFEFERVVDMGGTTGMENRSVQMWENKHVHILEFENYEFVPAR